MGEDAEPDFNALANPNCYSLIPFFGGSGVEFTIDKNQIFSNPVDFDAN